MYKRKGMRNYERNGTDHPDGIFGADAEILYRLCDERHCRAGIAGCAGRIKAGTAQDAV